MRYFFEAIIPFVLIVAGVVGLVSGVKKGRHLYRLKRATWKPIVRSHDGEYLVVEVTKYGEEKPQHIATIPPNAISLEDEIAEAMAEGRGVAAALNANAN